MRRVPLVLSTLALAACIEDIAVGDSTIRGTYTLRTVNGAVLPFTRSVVGATRVELLDDRITLYMGGTFAEESHLRTTVNGQATTATVAETGTYAPSFGNSVTINGNSGVSRVVTIDNGNTMNFSENGAAYIWKK